MACRVQYVTLHDNYFNFSNVKYCYSSSILLSLSFYHILFTSMFLTCFLTCYLVSILICRRLSFSTVHNLSHPLYHVIILRLPLLWLLRGPVEPSLVVDVSLLLQPQSGTACQKQSSRRHLWRCSERHWRRNCSCHLIPTNRLNNYLHYVAWLTACLFPGLEVFALLSR